MDMYLINASDIEYQALNHNSVQAKHCICIKLVFHVREVTVGIVGMASPGELPAAVTLLHPLEVANRNAPSRH